MAKGDLIVSAHQGSNSVAEEFVQFGVGGVQDGVGPAVELLEAAFVAAEAD